MAVNLADLRRCPGSSSSSVMALPLLSGVCLLLLSSAHSGPIPSPGERRSVVDNVDVQEVLGQFLHMLNLTDQGPRSRARTEPPEYMLELYNRFTSDRSAAPAANIIRSFRNEEHSSQGVLSSGVRIQHLLFNISVPQQESVVSAELRLHMFLRRDKHITAAWKVTIYDTWRDGRYGIAKREPLASKHVHRKDSGWEVFDMTSAIWYWRKVGVVTPRLEVHIEHLKAFRSMNDWRYVDLDIDRDPDGKHEPVLIVFSDDQTEAHEEMDVDENQEETLLMQMRSNALYEDGARVRRSAIVEDCKKAEMYVDFKDIGWDSFILAPSGYQAFTCRGACNYPLARELTPTKHAIVQTLLNLKSPQRTAQACCVPTELKPISLLYENENGVVVLNNKYEGMVVKECGCR